MKGFRDRALQVLFAMTLVWLSLWVLAQQSESVFGLIPESEESWLHEAVEIMVVLAIFALFAAAALYCFRRWPWFLRVPDSISLAWLTVRLLGYAPLLFTLLAAAIFSAWWLLVVSGEDPAHSQYGLSAWFAAWFYSIYLTPMFTVVMVWFSAVRRDRRETG